MRAGCRPLARTRLAAAVATLAGLLGLAGCATPPPATRPAALAAYRANNDPLEPTNRVFFAVNNGIDRFTFRPLAIVYRQVPRVIRNPIHNVLDNMGEPVVFANDILETKSRRAGDTLMRFLINTTVGIGGAFDFATGWGYPAHDADFGITLALWGLPNGPFLFLPVLGPSSPRDATGFGVDTVMDPYFWPPNGGGFNTFRITRTALSAVDARERVLDATDQINKTALDPYATYRSLYQQHRQSQIDTVRSDNRATVPDWFSPR
jgi:phospholipid-binding lipoprotein MlaA